MNLNDKHELSLSEFQEKAMSFRLPSADQAYVTLGLVGEVGELYGYLAKSIRDNYEPDMAHVEKELGDILWFVAALSQDCGLNLATLAQKNLDKLADRKKRSVLQGSGDTR